MCKQNEKQMKTLQTQTQTQIEFHLNQLKEAKTALDKAKKDGLEAEKIQQLEYSYANQVSWVADLSSMEN